MYPINVKLEYREKGCKVKTKTYKNKDKLLDFFDNLDTTFEPIFLLFADDDVFVTNNESLLYLIVRDILFDDGIDYFALLIEFDNYDDAFEKAKELKKTE